MSPRNRSTCQALLIGLAMVLLADLFLNWRISMVDVPGIGRIQSHSMGWAGWGAVVGTLLIALLIVESVEAATGARWTERLVGAAALLAVTVLLLTVGTFVGNAWSISNTGVVAVTVDPASEWPAYVGLMIAGLVTLVAVARLAMESVSDSAHRARRTASETPATVRRRIETNLRMPT
jgi:hypothetical protein